MRLLWLRTESRPESLTLARQRVRDALAQTRLRPEAIAEMDVAAGEVLSNTYQHAYYSGIGRVFVEVFEIRRSVTVVVVDMGDAVVAPVIPNTLPYPTRTGGRGLYLASRLSDELKFAVNRIGHGLTVRITRSFEDGPIWPGRSDAKHMFESITARKQLRHSH